MTFRRDARLDTSQVRDRRGMSAGKGVAAGGEEVVVALGFAARTGPVPAEHVRPDAGHG